MQIRLDTMPWNQRMKILRTLKGWSQEEAANKCNTNQKVYWSWETAKRYPRKNSRTAIARAFGVTEAELFGIHKNKKVI
jgi:transcriptional regulator with XRE-family HTH domain